MQTSRGKLFILSGPSGVGKSTVLKAVLERLPTLYFSISATTRPPRPGEINGVHYHFITEAEFADMQANDQLLEWARYVDNAYGTPAAPIEAQLNKGLHALLDIEVQGALQVKTKMPEAVAIFLAPPSMETLEQRLRGRKTDAEDKIQSRLATARLEFAQKGAYDHIVVNDTVAQAAAEIVALIGGAE